MNDIRDVNNIIIKAKSSKITLKYQHFGDDNDLCLMIFSDTVLGNLTDGSSQGGYLIFLVGKSAKVSPIWWKSKKIRRVVRSKLAAETMLMCKAIVYSYIVHRDDYWKRSATNFAVGLH